MMTIVAAIAGALVGALATGVVTWYIQRTRLQLGYDIIEATSLPDFEIGPEDFVKIMVRSDVLGNTADSDPDSYWNTINTVYKFMVRLRNTGNRAIERQDVVLELDTSAKVIPEVSIDKSPELGTQYVEAKRDARELNVVRLSLPYLNPGQEVVVSVISVENSTRKCLVHAGAPNMKVFDLGRRERVWEGIIVFGALGMSLVGLVGWMLTSETLFSPEPRESVLELSSFDTVLFQVLALAGLFFALVIVFLIGRRLRRFR